MVCSVLGYLMVDHNYKDWREIIKDYKKQQQNKKHSLITKFIKAYKKYDYNGLVKYSEQILKSQGIFESGAKDKN